MGRCLMRANAARRAGRARPTLRRGPCRLPMKSFPKPHGAERHGHRPSPDLGRDHPLRRHDVRDHGRLRPGHRPALPLPARQGRPGRGDEHRRPGVGRQRNLAGAGRGGPAGGLPGGLFGGADGLLPAPGADALGPDLPRRGLRVPLQGRRGAPALVGQGLHRRLPRRHLLPGGDPGGLPPGIHVVDRAYAGGALDWLTPFSLFTGLGLVVAYALLGCTWLIMKTDGPLQARMIALARPLVWAMVAVIGVISLWTPLAQARIAARWFAWPNLLWFAPVPVLVVAAVWQLLKQLRGAPHAGPFVLTLVLMFLGYSGLGISIWPNVIPPGISIWDAAAPPQSMGFALVGALLIIPFILMYSAWSYYVFRGKVDATQGYH